MRSIRSTVPTVIAAAALAAGFAGTGSAQASGQEPDRPVGWASTGNGVTGGTGAAADSVYVVRDRQGLVDAFANHGDPASPKVVYVDGVIDGDATADGRLLGAQDYASGWDIGKYQSCFGPDGTEWSDTRFDYCKTQRTLRVTGSNNQKRQIQLTVPSNTTLVGVGSGAWLRGVYLTVNRGTNIIVRNLNLEAPVDHFTAWDPGDGAQGAWNARFDAMSIVTGTNIWVDHCTFTDGRYPDDQAETGFHGEHIQHHDGLLDMEDGTDLVTVSWSRFLDHDKSLLIGSGDSHADKDAGHLRITFQGNLFDGTVQRSPRVRFGAVHLLNNYYVADADRSTYAMRTEANGGPGYFVGMGYESQIYSDHNVFSYVGGGASDDVLLRNWKGYRIFDDGSWYNGAPARLVDVARSKYEAAAAAARDDAAANGTTPPAWATVGFSADAGWRPADVYSYPALTNPTAVKSAVLARSGTGKLEVDPPR